MSEDRRLRAAIIGCGVIASDHVATVKTRCGPVQLALCDVNSGVAAALNEKHGLNATIHADARELLKEQPFDVVHILTPPDSHYELARLAIEAGAHVFVEKPMTLTLEETRSLYQFAEQKQRLLCVGHSLLYMDCVRKALDLVRSGRIGRVVAMHCFFGHAEKQKTIPYRGVSHWSYRLPGGPLINLISHPASVIVELLGRPGKLTYLSQSRNVMPHGYSDLLDVAVTTDAGVGTFIVSMAHGNASRYFTVECEKGSISVDLARQLVTRRIQRPKLSIVSKLFGGIGQGTSLIAGTVSVLCRVVTGRLKPNPGTRELVARFYHAVRTQGQSPVSRDNVLGVAEIIEQVLVAGQACGDVKSWKALASVLQACPPEGTGTHTSLPKGTL